jgi:hypothetical protein
MLPDSHGAIVEAPNLSVAIALNGLDGLPLSSGAGIWPCGACGVVSAQNDERSPDPSKEDRNQSRKCPTWSTIAHAVGSSINAGGGATVPTQLRAETVAYRWRLYAYASAESVPLMVSARGIEH